VSGAASLAAVIVAIVFAWAAIAKAIRHGPTVTAFAALGVPAPALLATLVPIGELGIAGTLVVRPDIGGALALAALAAFTLVVIRAVLAGSSTGCGCFGSPRSQPVSPADVVRNGILAAFAAVATGTRSLQRPGAGALAGVAAGVVVAIGVMVLSSARLRRPQLPRPG